LLYTADAPTCQNTSSATYADDTAILATYDDHTAALVNLDEFSNWTESWRINVNDTKSVRVDFNLRSHPKLGSAKIPTAKHLQIKYQSVHLGIKLNSRVHISKRREESTVFATYLGSSTQGTSCL